MIRSLRIFLVFVTSCVITLGRVTTAAAQEPVSQFSSSIATEYTVNGLGDTHVVHTIEITNKTPTTFIRQYALKTTSADVRTVEVKYNDQALPANIVTTQHGTTIAIDFPDDIVGEGKIRTFSIGYHTAELATIGGRVLEVHVPHLGAGAAFDQQSVVVHTPRTFGRPVRATPQPDGVREDEQFFSSSFDHLAGQGISLQFGEKQVYDATIRYTLENPGSSEALGQIALPPDTSFQRVYYHSLEPLPESLKRDQDGNWIATYRLLGNQTITVNLFAAIQTTLEPDLSVPVTKPQPVHTSAQPYWEVSNGTIVDKAREFATPQKIYQHVVDTLSYSSEATGKQRLGALEAFKQPANAVCQEFTDAFVAIARATSIPARRLTGYAYTQNENLRPANLEGDVLHAWPEYFDSQTNIWRPIDPTWEDTTKGVDYFSQFDLNHIVFAINGSSSTTPYAAGFYKTESVNTKDISISFGTSMPTVSPQFTLRTTPQRVLGIPIPGLTQVVVNNSTGQAYYDLVIKLSEPSIGEKLVDLPTLLPFETQTLTLTTFTPSWSLPKQVGATATIRDSQNTILYESQLVSVTTAPPIFGQVSNPTIILGVGISAAVTTLATGSVLVFRRKQYRFVRRQSKKS